MTFLFAAATTTYKAVSQQQIDPNFFAGCLSGCGLVAFIWLVVYLISLPAEHYHELFIDGVHYSTKRANRVVGKVTQRIAKTGQLISVIHSLWKGWDGKTFFILRIDELNSPLITPVKTLADARNFILQCSDEDVEEAKRLMRDWIYRDMKVKEIHH